MRIPIWLISLSAALLCTQRIDAQEASPEQIQKALELLRAQETAPSQPAPQPIQAQPEAVKVPQSPSTTIAPTVIPPANTQPTAQAPPPALEPATTEAQQKAMELLRSIQSASPPPAQTTVKPATPTTSDQDRDAAIRAAIQEAEAIADQQKKARQQNPRAVSEAEMQQEINRIEAEILKAKGAQPPEPVPEPTVIAVEAIPATPATTTIQIAPAESIPAALSVQSSGPATGMTPPGSTPTPPHPELVPMTPLEEQNARRLLEQTAPVATPKQPTVVINQKSTSPPVTVQMPTPPQPALSGTKEQKLAELLRSYKNDEISPADYHKERARILAGP